jgi:hypothetical protein
MPPKDSELRRESLVRMAGEPTHAGSFAVSEGLLDHDEALATWRQNHILMVSSARSAASTAPETRAESRFLRATLGRGSLPRALGPAKLSVAGGACGPRQLLLGGLEVGTGPAGVVGDVEHPRDLGDELLDGNLDSLAKRDGCHAAKPIAATQAIPRPP